MKKGTCILCFLVAAFILYSQAYALDIIFDLSDPDIMVGESFDVEVVANNVFVGLDPFEEVLAFGFDIVNSDSTIVGFNPPATVEPPFMDDSGFFPDTDVAGSTFPGITPPINSFPLATLNFTALAPGIVTLGIFSDVSDPNEGLVYFLQGNQDISSTFNLNVPIPEPGTILLLGLGLFGLMGFQRKLKKS